MNNFKRKLNDCEENESTTRSPIEMPIELGVAPAHATALAVRLCCSARLGEQQFDELATSVLDEASNQRACSLDDNAVARLAMSILSFHLVYDYFDGTWVIETSDELRHRDGNFVRHMLLQGVAADELLKAADNQSWSNQQRALLRSTAERLKTSASLCERVAELLEWQQSLWHAPPPPPVVPIEQDPALWLVAEWLAGVLRHRLVRRNADLPRICGRQSYSSARPALLSDLWTDFCGSVQDTERLCVRNERHFALLVADWLNEWPHRHSCFSEAHWLGYEWHWTEHPRQACMAVRILLDPIRQGLTPMSARYHTILQASSRRVKSIILPAEKKCG